MKSSTVFTLIVGVIFTIVIFGAFAEVPYTYSNGQFSVGVKKVILNLNGYDPWHIMAKPINYGGLLDYLAYSWYTNNPASGGTAISSFSLTLSGISANGQYVKASSGAMLNTANVTVQIYSKPYNNSAWQLDGSNSWTDVALPFSQSSWSSPSYSLTSLNQQMPLIIPNAILEIPITISNTQSVATPDPLQVLISINPSLYTKYESADLGNIRFYNSSGIELYAWLESYSGQPSGGNPNQATNANIWVKLSYPIPADSKTKIYMVFLATYTDFSAKYWGEAPTLSSPDGIYDNGKNVFTYYQNFGGLSSLPSGWTLSTGSVEYGSQYLEVPGGSAVYMNPIPSALSAGSNTVWEFYGSFTSTSSFTVVGTTESAPVVGNGANQGNGYYFLSDGGYYDLHIGSDALTTLDGSLPSGPAIYSMVLLPSGNAEVLINYADKNNVDVSPVSTSYFSIVSSKVVTSSTTYTASPIYIYWLRARALPPNGVMPTVVVGSIPGSYQRYDFAIKLTVSGINAITGAPMSASTWLNLSSTLYWQGNIFKADIFDISGMTPTIVLPMYAIELLIVLWLGIIVIAYRMNREVD